MKLGIISDIHLTRKTQRLLCALKTVQDAAALLIAGDLADRAQKEPYDLLLQCIREHLPTIPVYCVSGNHDNPARDDTQYRAFEQAISPNSVKYLDARGAFHQQLTPQVDLFGLNPLYHQKLFFFPNGGEQLDFLEKSLTASKAAFHIVLCHPPLSAHNPQRSQDRQPYFSREQDSRLQRIIDSHRNVLFVSGHTHVAPSLEPDADHGNLYLNDGSLCPTTTTPEHTLQQGNATLLDITETELTATIMGIHTGKIFWQETFPLPLHCNNQITE